MKSTDHSIRPAHARLVCVRCGTSVFSDADTGHELTSTSHAGRTAAQERAGHHQVAMDLCRHCLREVLRHCLSGGPGDAQARQQHFRDAAAARQALRSLEDTEAFVRASNARLDALRAAEDGDEARP